MKPVVSSSVFKKLRYLLAICLFMLPVINGFADHFRYGNISWTRVPGQPNTIRFNIKLAFQIASLTPAQKATWKVGSAYGSGQFTYGDGTTQGAPITVTSINSSEDWFFGEAVLTKTYTNSGVYTASYSNCCRISGTPGGLQNNGNDSMIVSTKVQVGASNPGNESPVSNVPPFVNFIRDTNYAEYQIPAIDPNGDALTYSLSPNGIFGTVATTVQPTGLTISPTGLLTWSTIGKLKGQFFNTSVRVTDSKGAYITLDFLIRIVGKSLPATVDNTVTPPNGTTYEIQPGDSVNFKVVFKDPDGGPNDSVKIQAIGAPAGSTFTQTGSNPDTGTFGWKPTPTQQGNYLVNFTSTDDSGVQNNTVVNFDVSYKPRFDVPTMPGNNSVFTLTTGQNITHPVKAYHPTTTDGVNVTIESGLKSGMTYTPAFPLAVANPVTTSFSWTPTSGQWGVNKVVYKAKDTFYLEQAFDTIYYLVDNAPVITSTPILYAHVGQLYNYLLTATDADIPAGDKTKIENITKPGFINVTDNSNNTFNLAGIPTISDIGTYNVSIEVADSLNHFLGTHAGFAMQNYTLVVVPALNLSGTPTHVTIFGASNGSVNAIATGGSGPLNYLWSNNATTQNITGVPAGKYWVTVTDNFGGVISDTFYVLQPAQLTVSGTTVNVGIFGQSTGIVDITPAGGVGPYSYSWSNMTNSQDLSGVLAGTYNVTVTDANGATATGSYTVLQPAQLTVSGTKTDVTIFGLSNGTIDITPAGGVGPYTYNWGGGVTSEDRTGLAIGTYNVTVTDANGATASTSLNIIQPAQLTVSGTTVNVGIFGQSTGIVDITPAGGVGPYSYSWSNMTNSQDLSGVLAGTYNVTVTDANGATATGSYTVLQPAQLTVSGTKTDVTIFGLSNGTIDITPAGGVGPYTYNWGGGVTSEDRTGLAIGTYNVTVTDANGATASTSLNIIQPAQLTVSGTTVNVGIFGQSTGIVDITPAGGVGPYSYSWSNMTNSQDLSGVLAGTYNVTVTDANGATATGSYTVLQPAQLTVSGTKTDVTIFGLSNGTIDITPAGGVGPYTYNWGGGVTSEDRTGLAIGTYNVTVTDANGATASANFTLTQPAQLTVAGTVVNVNIFGGSNGSVDITPAGGVGPYTYAWSNAATVQDLVGVIAGIYSVTVTDANGATATGTYTVLQPLQLAVTGTVTDATIYNVSNGAVDITPVGGVGPYVYLWSNLATTQDLTNVHAGTYTVTVTDLHGAIAIKSFVVGQPAQLTVSGVKTNVTIFGGNNGAIDITPAGGVGPYTYNWGGGITSEDRTGLTAGTYSVTVTDANGATANASFTITQPNQLVLTYTKTNVTTYGGNNGTIDLSVAGGVGPYTYNWGGGVTTQDRSGLPAGTYTVVVTDANGATATTTVLITQPIIVPGVVTNVTIFGGNNGAIDITPAGGVGPYTYNWGGGVTTEDRTGLIAGTYSVTVTDTKGATASASFTVTQPAQLVLTTTKTNVTIYGGSNGTIDLTVAGGVGPYTYNWGGGVTTEDRTGLPAGTYTVTVTDANGATANISVTITQPNQLTVSGVVSNVTIFGGSNGAINITTAGGVGPYTYNWGAGVTSEDRTGLTAGTYSVTVTDANGATATGTYTVTQPTQLVATYTKTNVTIYGGTTGSIDLTVAGGVGPYTYNWGGGITTEDRTNLPAGTYTVIVTDANGATATVSVTITQPAQLTVSGIVSNVTIFGGNNGAINITPAGGVGPYTYNWGGGVTTEDRTGLIAGTYSVTVTDANGATATGTYTVTQPTQLTVTGVKTNVTIYGANNGTITLIPAGGVGPYTYNWGGGVTTKDRTGLAPGTYNVTITDANGATTTASFTITQPTQLTVSGVVTNVTTYGGTNGAINITAAGGVGPYTYNWGGGVTNEDRSGIPAGTYSVTVTDANGATAVGTYTVTQPTTPLTATLAVSPVYPVSGQAPYTIYLGYGSQSVTMTVTPVGGTAPYTYTWTPVTDLSSTNTASTVASPVVTTTYAVTVKDANNATVTLYKTINVVNVRCSNGHDGHCGNSGNHNHKVYVCHNTNSSSNPTELICIDINAVPAHLSNHSDRLGQCLDVTGNDVDVACYGGNNGSIDITAVGGIPPYTYKWNNNSTVEDRTGLTAGTYTVTVTDAIGSITGASFTITQPSQLTTSVSKTNVKCYGDNNGVIDLSVSGGKSPYSYSWSNNKTTQDLSGLATGTYNVTVTDANGCTTANSATISQPSSAIAISGVKTNVSCNNDDNGAIDITVTGGTAPYTYDWDDNNNSSSNNNNYCGRHSCGRHTCWNNYHNNNNNNSSSSSNTQDLNSLEAGTYNVTVTDANGCTKTASFTITEPTAVTVAGTKTNVTCYGSNNGSITITAAGGTAPYTYKWNNNSTAQNRTGLAGGTYSVIVTDANGCTTTGSWTISQPSSGISTSISKTNVMCYGSNNGSINLSVSGGSSSYSYSWSNNATTQDLANLAGGTYNVTVTDANGCTATNTATITQPSSGIAITGTKTNVTCYNGSNGSITIAVTGGASPYSYKWNNNSTSQNRNGLCAGTYSVTVTDASGCTKTESYTITQPSTAVSASISVNPNPTVSGQASNTIFKGYGAQSVTLTASATGGAGSYTYSWYPTTGLSNASSASTTATPSSTTTYTVTVTDASGCTRSTQVTITVKDVRDGSKIIVCRNGYRVSVSSSSVPSYLNNGYTLGACDDDDDDHGGCGNKVSGDVAVINDLKLYPNPSTGIFFIELPSEVKGGDAIIMDMNGKVVEHKMFMPDSKLSFDLSSVARGTYLVQIINGTDKYQARIILQ